MRRKIMALIAAVLLLAQGCALSEGADRPPTEDEGAVQTALEQDDEGGIPAELVHELPPLPEYSTIALFEQDKVYYMAYDMEKITDKNIDTPPQVMYCYDYKTGETKRLFTFRLPNPYRDIMYISNNRFYLIERDYESFTDKVVEVDLATLKKRTISTFDADRIVFANIYPCKEMIVLHTIKYWASEEGSENNEYSVETIDPKNGGRKEIVRCGVKDMRGEAIACIDTGENVITAFRESILPEKESTYDLLSYDVSGKLLSQDALAYIHDFEYNEATEIVKGDNVVSVFRFGQFVVYNTVNGRTLVGKLAEKGDPEVVGIPEELYSDVLDNTNRLIGGHGQQYSKIYFQKTRGEQVKIFAMDTEDGSFTEHVLHEREEGKSYGLWRNQAGDLLEMIQDSDAGTTVYRVLETSKMF
jgi:hypothetical protein